MSKHTPGPWTPHFEEAYYVSGPDLGRVAMMMNLKGRHGMGGRRSGDESAANALLISAAPDLLRELERLCKMAEDGDVASWSPTWDDARDAIAKATGEPS